MLTGPASFSGFDPLLTPTHKHGLVHADPRTFRVWEPLVNARGCGWSADYSQSYHTPKNKPLHRCPPILLHNPEFTNSSPDVALAITVLPGSLAC